MKRGFSLLELLIVLTIVGVISSIGFVVYVDHYEGSRKATALSSLNLVMSSYKSMLLLDPSVSSINFSSRATIEEVLFSNAVRLQPAETAFRIEVSSGSIRARAEDAEGGWQLCVNNLFQAC